MLRIDINKVKPGMSLALPVQNPQAPSRTLLKVGYELTPTIIDRLRDQGVRVLWVRYPSLAYLEELVDGQLVRSQNEVVSQISSTFETLQNQASAKLSYDQYTDALRELVDQLLTHPQSAMFLGDLSDVSDELMRHSASVTYLSLLLGLKLESYLVKERKHVAPDRAKEVVNLGLGAMLHDIGLTQLDAGTRERFASTGDETDTEWQEHPALGFRLVRSQIDPSAATVVLNHHQRYDGSGFSGGGFPQLTEKNIHVFARITAVADHFDRMRYPANLPPQPTVFVLSSMLREPLRHKFDPEVLSALLAVVPPYPPGSIVKLSDGRYAVCIDHDPADPCRPKVQVIPEPTNLDAEQAPGATVDLREHRATLEIAEHEEHDVRDLNFEPPEELVGVASQQMAWR